MDKDRLKEIVRIYAHAKELFLLAEETDILREPAREFVQPVNEIRHAFDHLMRAFGDELGLKQGDANANLDKALGHVYRSFFDAADWCAINLREWVIVALEPFSVETIQSTLPSYYDRIRPEIDRISLKIAELRGAKDVTREGGLPCVEEYMRLVHQLVAHTAAIREKLGALADYEARRWREKRQERGHAWALAILGAIVGALAGWLLAWLGTR